VETTPAISAANSSVAVMMTKAVGSRALVSEAMAFRCKSLLFSARPIPRSSRFDDARTSRVRFTACHAECSLTPEVGGSLNLRPFDVQISQTLCDQVFTIGERFRRCAIWEHLRVRACVGRNKQCGFLKDFGGAARI
jgi:hypothetical protein